jgi:hypothetical protein
MTQDQTLSSPWLQVGGHVYTLEQVPALLEDLDLIPLLLRRLVERQVSVAYQPTRDQQVDFQQQFLQRERITDQASLAAWLQRQGLHEDQMSNKLYRALQLELFKQDTFAPRVEQLFLERKQQLDQAVFSLIRVNEQARSMELHRRIEEEESPFAQLASQYSEGAERQLNGQIGPLELGRVNSVVAERLRISKPGQLWPPLHLENWWVILRLERLIPAQLDDAMRQRLIQEMHDLYVHDLVSAAMAQLGSPPPPASLNNPAAPSPSELSSEGSPTAELPAADPITQVQPQAPASGFLANLFGRRRDHG